MGRPRVMDVDTLLDHARALWVADGVGGVTTRALSARARVSNGAIYHRFGSRDHLLAAVWAREAAAFRAFQHAQFREARGAGSAADAIIASALTTGAYAQLPGAAPQVLLATQGESFGGSGVPDEVRAQLREHRAELAPLLAALADDLWERHDEVACRVIRICLVDIPARIFLSSRTPNDPLARYAIEHAVRGLLTAGPPALPAPAPGPRSSPARPSGRR